MLYVIISCHLLSVSSFNQLLCILGLPKKGILYNTRNCRSSIQDKKLIEIILIMKSHTKDCFANTFTLSVTVRQNYSTERLRTSSIQVNQKLYGNFNMYTVQSWANEFDTSLLSALDFWFWPASVTFQNLAFWFSMTRLAGYQNLSEVLHNLVYAVSSKTLIKV